MKVLLEFTTDEFNACQGLTLAEMIEGKKTKAPVKKSKPKNEDVEEDEETDEDVEEDEETDEDETEEEPEVDDELLRNGINAAVKAGNKEKVATLFAKFKAKTIAGLKEAHYEKFYAGLKPLMKKK
jgi:hypothetical protein